MVGFALEWGGFVSGSESVLIFYLSCMHLNNCTIVSVDVGNLINLNPPLRNCLFFGIYSDVLFLSHFVDISLASRPVLYGNLV